ncbi:SRPBCC domain-containing protein [Streptomyces sp. MUM 203J]|uniref:SRPBCC domain-containing protein n=1 Tax=Streptomyces sp. MUM 203J TaxID=2791990 RepID=UPI001F04B47F|nr:SRPBCC domain-containing protein [Streptomyces sp. MUM 203J]MCH0541398.1 SRPBCC domain-containing protein [Streptomyces sp. MUM 203J]
MDVTAARNGTQQVVRHVVSLPHPEEDVWPALATRHGLRSWLAAAELLEPRLGGAVALRWLDDPAGGPVSGTVTAWDVERVVEYTLSGGDRVRFHLEPGEHGDRAATVLRLTHTFRGADALREEREAAWGIRFDRLRAVL